VLVLVIYLVYLGFRLVSVSFFAVLANNRLQIANIFSLVRPVNFTQIFKEYIEMRNLFILCAICVLTACASKPLNPEASLVRLTTIEPGNECEFLGDITGNQGDFITGEFTSNKNLETGARHDLKNQAHKMGGNVVFLLTQRAGQTASMTWDIGGTSVQTNVTLSGNVYFCPTN
jgi:hypothetical protein